MPAIPAGNSGECYNHLQPIDHHTYTQRLVAFVLYMAKPKKPTTSIEVPGTTKLYKYPLMRLRQTNPGMIRCTPIPNINVT